MKRLKYLMALPICFMLLATPVSSIRAEAVTVDINDNYDAGLLGEESDSGNNQGDESNGNDNAGTENSNANENNAGNAASAVSTVTPDTTVTPTQTTTTPTQTNDLPRTGDDNRITLTFIGMLASFSVFLLALISGKKFGKNA